MVDNISKKSEVVASKSPFLNSKNIFSYTCRGLQVPGDLLVSEDPKAGG